MFVPVPTVDRVVAFADLPDRTFRITDVHGSDRGGDGWGYNVSIGAESECGGESRPYTLWQGDYGTATGWRYVR